MKITTITMKRLIVICLCMLLVIIITACSVDTKKPANSADSTNSTKQEVKYTIKYAHLLQEENLVHKAATAFKNTVEEKTNGAVQVQIYPAGQTGNSDEENLELIMANTIQVSNIPLSTMSKASGLQQFYVFDLPFVFTSDEMVYDFWYSDTMQELAVDFQSKTKAKPLDIYLVGWLSIGSTKGTISKPDDLKGLKIRTAQTQIVLDTMNTLGSNPTAIAYGEAFTAMQTGVVDAILTPGPLLLRDKFFEVNNSASFLRSSPWPHILMINEDFFNSLPEEYQDAVLAGAIEHEKTAHALFAQEEYTDVPKGLADAGLDVVELTDEQLAAFQEATKGVVERANTLVGQDFYDKAMDFINNYE